MTPLQQALVDFIAAQVEACGVAPATDDITRRFQSRPDASVARALEGIAALGHVRQIRGRWELLGSEWQSHLALGEDAPAGLP